jgi:hypothetical protein
MKVTVIERVLRLILLLMVLLVTENTATAATLSARYEKTLGQSNAGGSFHFVTSGGRIAVDEAGNAYFGTPGGNSYLQKISPQGAILWQSMPNVPGFQGTAVDGKYLYTCGSGYYGYRQLQRWSREDGKLAPGWQYEWKDANSPVNGVRPLKLPNALVVDGKYIYVADNGGDEIRRFDKVSGAEAPFPQRLMVASPVDLALSAKNTLLLLTQTAVVETDKDGLALRVPVISGLRTPTALDVDRKNGAIYITEGGDGAELVNRIRVFNSDVQMTNEIGIGGEYSGRWHPQSFAFSCGGGDVALDGKGGFWVNGYGARLDLCPLLSHFSSAQSAQADVVLRGVKGRGLAVDDNLNVYVGGNFKLSWDDRLLWTSGLVPDASDGLFPYTGIPGWTMLPVAARAKQLVIAAVHNSRFYQVNVNNGAATGKVLDTGGTINGFCAVGNDLFYTTAPRIIQRTTLDLDAPQPFLTLPESAAPATGALVVSDDQQRFYLSGGGETACYDRNGKQLWKTKGGLGVLWKGVLFLLNANGTGITALDAQSGAVLTTIGDKAEAERPSLVAIGGVAVGSRDDEDYLFVLANAGVLVYRIGIA